MTLPPWRDTIHHDGSPFYLTPLFPEVGQPVRIRLRIDAGAPVQEVYLRWTPDGEQMYEAMAPGEPLGRAQVWEIIIEARQPVVHYHFLVKHRDGVLWYNGQGPRGWQPSDAADFRLRTGARTPAWLSETVFYQIFPDTFANGDPSVNPDKLPLHYPGHRPQTFAWGETVPDDLPFPDGFFGGDLPGVAEKLDYLTRLGVNGIYLNPIFRAPSNHRYDVVDYFQVDPRLGGAQALVDLREALTQRKMRYLLDIVPNHCGMHNPWFKAARDNSDAPEADYFTFGDHPNDYHCWLGFPSLPKFNYQSKALRELMFERSDAVFRRWLKPPYSADGWRIDVANMLGRQGEIQMNEELCRTIRRVVKETNEDAYLVGEHFFDAAPQLQGDMWDGVMNYAGFYTPLMHWLSGFKQHVWHKRPITSDVPFPTEALTAAWRNRRAAIPFASALAQLNLLGSHDTDRLFTRLGKDTALQQTAAVLLFAFPGVPCIYYGDELCLENVPKYGSRTCMPWQKAGRSVGLFDFYQKLTYFRRETPALREGGFQILHTDQDSLAFQREHPDGDLIAVANRADTRVNSISLHRTHHKEGTRFRELLTGQEATVKSDRLEINQPKGGALWLSI